MGFAERKLTLLQEIMAMDSIGQIEALLGAVEEIKTKKPSAPLYDGTWEENERILTDRINKFDEAGGIPAERVHEEMQNYLDSLL